MSTLASFLSLTKMRARLATLSSSCPGMVSSPKGSSLRPIWGVLWWNIRTFGFKGKKEWRFKTEAHTQMIFRPDGQDTNTFRLQLEALADTILQGAPMVNANLEDGIAAVKVMVAISHSARHGGDWVNVEEVEGDLANSFLKRPKLPPAWKRSSGSRELQRSAFGLESIDRRHSLQ